MIREAFLETVDSSAEFLLLPELAERWSSPSALEGYTIGGLAGHTARAAITVDRYLEAPAPSGNPISAAEYFIGALGDDDPITSEAHRAVRERGARAGAIGPAALAGEIRSVRQRLASRFENERADRLVSVYEGACMLLDDYLETRLVELTVHLDDLAASIQLPPPTLRDDVEAIVLRILVAIGTARHGAPTMIRALARRERVTDWPTAL